MRPETAAARAWRRPGLAQTAAGVYPMHHHGPRHGAGGARAAPSPRCPGGRRTMGRSGSPAAGRELLRVRAGATRRRRPPSHQVASPRRGSRRRTVRQTSTGAGLHAGAQGPTLPTGRRAGRPGRPTAGAPPLGAAGWRGTARRTVPAASLIVPAPRRLDVSTSQDGSGVLTDRIAREDSLCGVFSGGVAPVSLRPSRPHTAAATARWRGFSARPPDRPAAASTASDDRGPRLVGSDHPWVPLRNRGCRDRESRSLCVIEGAG